MNYTDDILAAYARARDTDKIAGRDWYPAAQRIASTLADWSGASVDRVAAAIAALSPRNPWAWNVQDAAAYAYASTHGEDMPLATTFTHNRINAWAFLTGTHDWTGSALKVRSFVANIIGDINAVTVDVWAIRAATNGAESAVKNDGQYEAIAQAYRDAAVIVGETPRDLQAIVWLVVQRESLGQSKRTVWKPKRGTLSIVLSLLGAPEQTTLGL